MAKDRDLLETFFEHHRIIESQLAEISDRKLVAGIKKDVVYSNALRIKPHKVAIYGWHMPDSQPIRGFYADHADWYVDYSHGVRQRTEPLPYKAVAIDSR